MPRLSLSDINQDILKMEPENREVSGVQTIYLNEYTGEISYLKLSFRLDHLSIADLQLLKLAISLLGELNLDDIGYKQLENEIYLKSGGMYFDLKTLTDGKTHEPFVVFDIQMKALPNQWQSALQLLQRILTTTQFDHIERIRSLLIKQRTGFEHYISSSGHIVASTRALAYTDAYARIMDGLNGFDYYQFLCQWMDIALMNDEMATARMGELLKMVCHRENLLISVVSDHMTMDMWSDLAHFVAQFDSYESDQQFAISPYGILNEAFVTDSQVQYVCQAFHYDGYQAQDVVCATYISNDQLHQMIRAKGGAYGSGLNVHDPGRVHLYSYRDPELSRTLSVYSELGAAYELADWSDEARIHAIIGSMKFFDPPMTALMKGSFLHFSALTGLDKAYYLKQMQLACSTTVDDLHRFAKYLTTGLNEHPAYVVVGNKDQIMAEAVRFKSIYEINEHGLIRLDTHESA